MAVVRRESRGGSDPPTWIAERYELGGVLGRGGMGEVWAATDVRLDREVAVKLLRADLAEIDEVRQRFEGEARAAAALVHPNVVAVFDAGEEDGAPFIVMERLPGRTLADELAEGGPLSSSEARDLAVAVLRALEAAHGAGIVHRDVKPGNVLRATDGTWKVADFGIAKSAEAAGDLTVTGMMIGTPSYLAPERIDGEPATPASDLYALGVVLFEALTGRKPFAADSTIALAEQIRAGRAPALRELRGDVDPTLARVVERAMATDPRRRFAGASEMRRALREQPTGARRRATRPDDETQPRAAVRTTETRALPTKLRPERRARMSPRRWLVVAAAAFALLLVMGVVLSRRDSGPTSTPAPTSPSTAGTTAVGGSGQPGATVPKDLDRALEELRKAVQR
jgi:serine/threonine protein kinase